MGQPEARADSDRSHTKVLFLGRHSGEGCREQLCDRLRRDEVLFLKGRLKISKGQKRLIRRERKCGKIDGDARGSGEGSLSIILEPAITRKMDKSTTP